MGTKLGHCFSVRARYISKVVNTNECQRGKFDLTGWHIWFFVSFFFFFALACYLEIFLFSLNKYCSLAPGVLFLYTLCWIFLLLYLLYSSALLSEIVYLEQLFPKGVLHCCSDVLIPNGLWFRPVIMKGKNPPCLAKAWLIEQLWGQLRTRKNTFEFVLMDGVYDFILMLRILKA